MSVINYGDYLNVKLDEKNNNLGLKILNLELQKVGGEINIDMNFI